MRRSGARRPVSGDFVPVAPMIVRARRGQLSGYLRVGSRAIAAVAGKPERKSVREDCARLIPWLFKATDCGPGFGVENRGRGRCRNVAHGDRNARAGLCSGMHRLHDGNDGYRTGAQHRAYLHPELVMSRPRRSEINRKGHVAAFSI